MAKKTKKMAFGGPTGPMDNRPAMQSSGNSKAGAGQSVKQDGDSPGRQFGPMRGNDRGENVRGGNRPGMGRPGMVRPGFPSGGPMNPATPPRVLPTPDLSSGASVQGIRGAQPMMSPANIKFPDQQSYDSYVKRYNESMATSGGKQFNPGYAKGGAVKPKKMASGGMAKGSSGGRGWGMARGGKSAKVC